MNHKLLRFAPIKYNTEWYKTEGVIAVSILSPSMNSVRFYALCDGMTDLTFQARHLIALIIALFSTVLSFAMGLATIVAFLRLDLQRKIQLSEDYRLLRELQWFN